MVKKNDSFNAADRLDIRLLEGSIHFLTGEITEENVTSAIKWITYENLDITSQKVLTLYINSPGGDLYQAFALIDIMRNSHHSIRTIGIGTVMSAAFLIFASGSKGQRYIARNTGVMCHQYSDGLEGKHHDIKAQMKEGEYCNDRMLGILRAATSLPVAKIKSKLLPPSDVYLLASELVDFNVADHII